MQERLIMTEDPLATQRTADGSLEMMREKRLVKCGAMGIMGAMEPERRLGQGQMVMPGKSWYLN